MIKNIILSIIISLYATSCAIADEVISTMDNAGLSTLNEELRQSSSGLKTLKGQIADLLPIVGKTAYAYNGVITEDVANANGDVSITGLGFKPSLIIFTGIDVSGTRSHGSATSPSSQKCVYAVAGAFQTNEIWHLINSATTRSQVAVLKSMDEDGFTYTRTSTGTSSVLYILYQSF